MSESLRDFTFKIVIEIETNKAGYNPTFVTHTNSEEEIERVFQEAKEYIYGRGF
jgi:hypothetical protein